MSKLVSGCEWRRVVGRFDDCRELAFWKTLVAEALGTFFLVFVACGSCLASQQPGGSLLQIALCFGLAVATIVWGISHVSGGHINPAVTVAFVVTRRMTILKGFFYIAMQTGGATLGAYILYLCINMPDNLGLTLPDKSISTAQAFGIESLITFVLVFTVFSTCDSGREDLEGSGPLAIGLSVTLCHLFAIPYTGSSMNPARSFGPAAVLNKWDHQWVYWVSPITGGLAAALLYEHFFAVHSSLKGLKKALLSKSRASMHENALADQFDLEACDENAKAGVSVSVSTTDMHRYREDTQAALLSRYKQAEAIRGHHVGKLPTPRWYAGRQNSIGVGLDPSLSQLCLLLSNKGDAAQNARLRDITENNNQLAEQANQDGPKRDSVASLPSRVAEKTSPL